MKDLAGKVAVVTGGASGIGLALGHAFGQQGMKIVVADVEIPAMDAAVKQLHHAGIDAVGISVDVSSSDSVDALAEATFERFGTAHVICNNAGVGPGGVSWELPQSVWRWVIDVDLWGVINGIRSFVPRLVEQGEGHVVNTASVGGLLASPGMAPYSAAKHAVVGLSESLKQDLQLAGSPVGVTILCPSMTRTRMNNSGRNWPSRLGAMPQERLQPGHPLTRDSYRDRMDNEAMEPDVVADLAVAAVLGEESWVICDPQFEARATEHLMRMVTASKKITRKSLGSRVVGNQSYCAQV